MDNPKGAKLTPELIKSHIAEVIFEDREVGGHRVMHCHFKMDNGFVVYGKKPSTSIDPANFDEELAKKISYENTFDQLWELEAYRSLVSADLLAKAADDFKIDVGEYVVESNNYEYLGPLGMGNATSYIIQAPGELCIDEHHKLRLVHIRQNNFFAEEENKKNLKAAEEYIYSRLPASKLNSDLVMRVAKTCHEAIRAYNLAVGTDDSVESVMEWHETPEEHKKYICDTVKRIILNKDLEGELTPEQSIVRGIVLSFK